MPQQTDHATPMRMRSLDRNAIGRKIRLAGRMSSYEPATGLALVVDGEKGVIVDVSLCIDYHSSSWMRERLCQMMMIGHVEETAVSIASAMYYSKICAMSRWILRVTFLFRRSRHMHPRRT
ncbi:hypothetical protein AMATHDRAFT_143942 [Amanita thiersii Skay4041]|uniref:Uncharacterized protein n=1 Tax=Amanita thiersii Skay4041 TaxID=703135 RepID=A0A2A9NT63_9AGAR|nr:hypothetical protein AMATHDRAFT_143942 [Amanita thiersii Skay4041]